ncbi:MAG: acetate--CoA ligase family protein [Burkholderiaceae bacterium]
MTRRTDFAALMAPRAVAVIGASDDPGKFGGRILHTLIEQGYDGRIHPINPARETLLGHRCHASIADVGEPVDLAIMAVPQSKARQVVDECARAGVKGLIVVTSRFAESGPAGAADEAALVEAARRSGMRLLGPNCIGIVSPSRRFVLCPAPVLRGMTLPAGAIGLVSQSGAMMSTALDRVAAKGVALSHAISIGNQADVDLAEVIDFFIDDAATQVLCTYAEGIKSPAALVAAANRARRAGKPWLMVKAGSSEAGAAATFSHTASLAGDQRVFAAVCRAHGIVLMDDPEAMLLLASALARHCGRAVERVAVLSPSGGGCALAADRINEFGLELASFAPATTAAMAPCFGHAPANPIDVGAAADGASMSHTATLHRLALADPGVDLVLTVLTAAPDPTHFAALTIEGAAATGKPLLAAVLLGPAGEAARERLRAARVLYADSLDTALQVVAGWRQWSAFEHGADPHRPADLPVLPEPGPGALGEPAARAILSACGIDVSAAVLVQSPDEVAAAAVGLRLPLVVKIVSPDIVHKSEVGGVVLDLPTPQAAASAARGMAERMAVSHPQVRIDGFHVQEQIAGELELLIGIVHDEAFGPMVVVGAGGRLAELLDDVQMAPAPVSEARAHAMLSALRMAPMFAGLRGRPPADMAAAVRAVCRVGWLAHDWRGRIRELDINPLIVRRAGEGCVAVDARILIR